jgi:hypothetical protein
MTILRKSMALRFFEQVRKGLVRKKLGNLLASQSIVHVKSLIDEAA